MTSEEMTIRFRIPGKRKSDAPRLQSSADEITVGTDSACQLSIDDPVASGRHCRLIHRDGKFFVEDLESPTGSYLDGVPVQGTVAIETGATLVFGVSQLSFKLLEGNDEAVLEMALSERSFNFVEKGKGTKLADLYQWVRSEVVFGRSKALTWSNLWVGVATVALLGLSFAAAVREPLTDPGKLHASHRFDELTPEQRKAVGLRYPNALALVEEQGCSVCHDPFNGTPVDKCAQCHADILVGQHPPTPGSSFGSEEKAFDYWREQGCVSCHLDHTRGDAWDFVPPVEETVKSCAECHERNTKPRLDPAPIPKNRPETIAYDAFPHADHLELENPIGCEVCHEPVTDRDEGILAVTRDRDFHPADYGVCRECHVTGPENQEYKDRGWWPEPEHIVSIEWHGSEDPKKCTQCHAEVGSKPLAMVEIERERNQLFALPRRFEHARFFEGHSADVAPASDNQNCYSCHRDGNVTPEEIPAQPFLHGLHVAQLKPGSADEAMRLSGKDKGCLECHVSIEGDEKLSGDAYAGAKAQCARCHDPDGLNGVPTPSGGSNESVSAVQFPHGLHVSAFPAPEKDDKSTSATLASGCYSCHDFVGADGDTIQTTDRYNSRAHTLPGAVNCMDCHATHNNMAGAKQGCVLCHQRTVDGAVQDAFEYRGETRPKDWPAVGSFDHFSPGHIEDSQSMTGCQKCHDEASGLWGAKTIQDVPIPDETHASCRTCHVEQGQRFHWR